MGFSRSIWGDSYRNAPKVYSEACLEFYRQTALSVPILRSVNQAASLGALKIYCRELPVPSWPQSFSTFLSTLPRDFSGGVANQHFFIKNLHKSLLETWRVELGRLLDLGNGEGVSAAEGEKSAEI